MLKTNSKFKSFMRLFTLGYMGGTMYLLKYLRYVFYDQMIDAMGITNAQLGLLTSAAAIVALIRIIPGAYCADKFDAKRVMVFAIGGMTVLTFLFAAFVNSYWLAVVIWGMTSIVTFSYWSCLMKYVNNMNGLEAAASTMGLYYLINGLTGAFGNAVPLWVNKITGGDFRLAIVSVGVITAIATVLVIIFVDNEKKLAEEGIFLKGDEPIRISHITTVLKWPGTYMLFLTVFCGYTLYSNVSYFNPYLINVIGIDPTVSSGLALVRSYGAMLIAPLGGFMADKVFHSTSKWFVAGFTFSGLIIACVFLFGPNSNALVVSIYSLIPSLAIYGVYSLQYSILRELHVSPVVAGTVIGLGGTAVNVSDTVIPPLFGKWIDTYGNQGYTYIFVTLVAVAVLGVVVQFWVNSHDKKCKAGKRVMNLGKLKV